MSTDDKGARIELRPTDAYTASRKALNPRLRRSVGWVEEEIASDPGHNHWRRRLTDGSIIDSMAADDGLLIRYRVVSDSVVALLELINQREREQ